MRTFVRLAALFALALPSLTTVACRRRHYHVESAAVKEGRALYQKYCALCHGKKAEGYAADHANALGNADFLALASNEFLTKSITDGRPGTPMSPWGKIHGGPLEPKQVEQIVAYLRSLAKKSFVKTWGVGGEPGSPLTMGKLAGDPGRAALVFAERCKSCHGPRGEGSTKATSITHPYFLRNVSDGYLRTVISHGRKGTEMESFLKPLAGPPLTPETIDDLVAYLRTLEAIPGPPPPANYEPPPGLDQLVINPKSTPPNFTLREGRYVPAADVEKALKEGKKLVILDARPTPDWSRNHIVGSLPFPFYDIDKMAQSLPKDGTWIVAYCACPHAASGHVVDELRRRKFPNTAVLDEGIAFWTQKGYPTAQSKVLPPKD